MEIAIISLITFLLILGAYKLFGWTAFIVLFTVLGIHQVYHRIKFGKWWED